MKYTITSDLKRLSLDDAHLEDLIRDDKGMLFTFDGASLEHYIEQDINEPIITGKVILNLAGILSETFKRSNDKEIVFETPPADELVKKMYVIHSSIIDDSNRTLTIDGLYYNEGQIGLNGL